ncbi:L-fucose isomerase [Lacticaseibacillus parahuelsenbergensis]|uniref:L-fucose isomerase n=1 Tax=Lacticaseibacillus parahuelsenbergensis TaxID=3068305 RepID=A0ABY9L286_9LACO|nr:MULTISPECIES: L-fucose isomerase [Lacticaseibacillus]MDE3283625.1 L-fucose isomerase [Lacticaseibacillus casei]WLV77740.1 L-fucose isomerase [Lacticaseibacillus sp. NCIMB 15471]
MTNMTFPKIGIRPTIDGRRRGIRESLEDQTMKMAHSVADLLAATLKYPDGSPVQTVISDTTIGGVKEAAMSKEKFDRAGVCGTITVTPCWCYGSETMDMSPDLPHAIWGFNGTERPGAVYLAAVLAAHAQKGIPAFGIYGHDVQDADDTSIPDDVKTKLIRFAKGALATGIMRNKSYLSIGSVAMGIAGSTVDPDFFQEYLGMRNEYVDMTEIVRRWDEGIYDKEEFEKALAWAEKNTPIGPDLYNEDDPNKFTDEQKHEQLVACVKMTMIARDLMDGNKKLADMGFKEEAEGHNAIAAGFQGQRQWTDHFPNGDYMEAFMNSQYDWNGIHQPHVFATENDSLNATSMLFNYLLTNTPQIFADVRTYWSPEAVERVTGTKLEGVAKNGFLHLSNSGAQTLDATGQETIDGQPAIKPFYDLSEEEAQANLDHTRWIPANIGYFRGGGFSSNYVTRGGEKGMPVTMARLNLVKGVGPELQVAEGYAVDLPENVFDIINKRTDPGWPSTFFVPILTGHGAFKSVYDVMDNWGANHGAISYGHIGADLITLASILRIPVNMHNVPESDIFRPRAWSSLGTENLEAADFNACKNFGPLYK